jgi:hypothetical protein
MKTTLGVLLTSFILALGINTLQAQPGSGQGGGQGQGGGMGQGMNPEVRVQELIAELEITAEQESAFRAAMGQINELRMANMREMNRGNGGGMRQGGQGQGQGRGGQAQGDQAQGDQGHQGHQGQGDQGQQGHQGQRGQGGQGQGQGMERRAEMQRQIEALLVPVLTQAQMSKYREAEEARMMQMRERMGR